MDLKNKTVLVTGASSGIGQAIAVACAQEGAVVLVHFRGNEAGAKATLEHVNKHSRGFLLQADLTDADQVKKMFQKIAKEVGTIDVLVNNAGEATPGDFFNQEVWDHQLNNIFSSAVTVTQNFLKQNESALLRKVINITSVYGNPDGGNTEFFAYSAAKAALESTTVMLAKSNPNVLVNAVAPGYTWTPAWEGISDKEKKLCEERTMIGRFVVPEEIAQAAIALLQNDAITGQILTVDGGLMLKRLERR